MANWYVDKAGGSDSNGGAGTGDAFATLQHAHDQAADEDEVRVKAGGIYDDDDYGVELTKTITFKSWNFVEDEAETNGCFTVKSIKSGSYWYGAFRYSLSTSGKVLTLNYCKIMPGGTDESQQILLEMNKNDITFESLNMSGLASNVQGIMTSTGTHYVTARGNSVIEGTGGNGIYRTGGYNAFIAESGASLTINGLSTGISATGFNIASDAIVLVRNCTTIGITGSLGIEGAKTFRRVCVADCASGISLLLDKDDTFNHITVANITGTGITLAAGLGDGDFYNIGVAGCGLGVSASGNGATFHNSGFFDNDDDVYGTAFLGDNIQTGEPKFFAEDDYHILQISPWVENGLSEEDIGAYDALECGNDFLELVCSCFGIRYDMLAGVSRSSTIGLVDQANDHRFDELCGEIRG